MGEEVRRLAVEVGEVAPATSRHQDLLANPVGSLQNNHVAPTSRCSNGTHEAGCAATNNKDIGICHAGRIAGALGANETAVGFFAQFAHAFNECEL